MNLYQNEFVQADIVYKIFLITFAIVNIGAFFSMKTPVQTGLLVSIISIISFYILGNRVLKSDTILYGYLFVIYVFIEIISCPLGLFSEYGAFLQNNVAVLFYGVSFLLLPQLLFFNLGRCMPIVYIEDAIRYLLTWNLILIVCGIIFYIFQPTIYMNFIERALSNQFEVYGMSPRLVSYLGDSMSIGVICSTSFLLSLAYFRDRRRILYILVFAIGCVMSMQRGAWVSCIASSSIYYFLKNPPRLSCKIKPKRVAVMFLFVCIIMYLLYMINTQWADEVVFFDVLVRRFNELGDAASSRTEQWIGVTEASMRNLCLGLGTMSHKGVNMGFPLACPDGNYFRILGDLGYLGLICFLLLNLMSIINAFQRKYYGILCVILIFMAQAVGTNVFDLFYSSFIYWFFLGLSNRNDFVV